MDPQWEKYLLPTRGVFWILEQLTSLTCDTNVSFQKEKIRTSEDCTHQEEKGTLFAQLLWNRTHNPHWGHLRLRRCWITTFDELVVLQVRSATTKYLPPEPFAVLWAAAPDTGVSGGWAQLSWDIAGDCSWGQISAPVLEHLHSHMLRPAASLRGFPRATPVGIWPDLEVTYPGDGLTQCLPLNPGLLRLQISATSRVPVMFLSRCTQVLLFISSCY